MDYEMEELVPVVAKLAEKYGGWEHSSMTYEKAGQLMEAVLYCIGELEQSGDWGLAVRDRMPAQQAYDLGYRRVVEKVGQTLDLYHEVIQGFSGYGNVCLHDTVTKGIPQFFKWYDARFAPQNTLLTLDYPVLKDLSRYTGVDRIYGYLSCIRMEKLFLKAFPENWVIQVLSRYHSHYQDLVENLCEIVYREVIRHILAGKPFSEQDFTGEDERRLRQALFQKPEEAVRAQVLTATGRFVQDYPRDGNGPGSGPPDTPSACCGVFDYGNDSGLLEYLVTSVPDIIARLRLGG